MVFIQPQNPYPTLNKAGGKRIVLELED